MNIIIDNIDISIDINQDIMAINMDNNIDKMCYLC